MESQSREKWQRHIVVFHYQAFHELMTKSISRALLCGFFFVVVWMKFNELRFVPIDWNHVAHNSIGATESKSSCCLPSVFLSLLPLILFFFPHCRRKLSCRTRFKKCWTLIGLQKTSRISFRRNIRPIFWQFLSTCIMRIVDNELQKKKQKTKEEAGRYFYITRYAASYLTLYTAFKCIVTHCA